MSFAVWKRNLTVAVREFTGSSRLPRHDAKYASDLHRRPLTVLGVDQSCAIDI